jgi:hypothetical protein
MVAAVMRLRGLSFNIAATIVRSISPTKAGDIARAIQKGIKAAKAAHAG